MSIKALVDTKYFNLAGTFNLIQGKVRDIYDLGEQLLFIATDRVSAFDQVLPTPIPGRGIMLTTMTVEWLDYLQKVIGKLDIGFPVLDHIVSTNIADLPVEFQKFASVLKGRFMIVDKHTPILIEFILRGNISGSFWKEYNELLAKGGTDPVMLHGFELPRNLEESQAFPSVFFTPSTKGEAGTHDRNISYDEMVGIIRTWLQNSEFRDKVDAEELANACKKLTLTLFIEARKYAEQHGIIIPDTKFELALAMVNGIPTIVIIDEVLSSDSSRYWPLDEFESGRSQRSFDKQIIRDYLESIGWDKTAPAPPLPDHIVDLTIKRYQECIDLLFP